MNYMQNGKNILLHVCCGPCSTSSVERLLAEGWNPVLYFSNSNIDTKEEFEKRYAELLKVAALNGLRVIKDDYDHASWLSAISGFEDEREGGARCLICFDFNLRRAAIKAKELGLDHFATTLTVSRFKNSARIFSVGEKYEGFEKMDFKKKDGFNRSIVLSREMGLYRQNYCGCEFSKDERGKCEKTV